MAFVGALAGAAAVAAFALVDGGDPQRADYAWSVLAGVGNGFGTAFLYRGLSSGRMGVVAPVSGVGAALVPVVVGLATGERPGALVWAGMLAALPAIWLVASRAGDDRAAARLVPGCVDGVLAGLGFGSCSPRWRRSPRRRASSRSPSTRLIAAHRGGDRGHPARGSLGAPRAGAHARRARRGVLGAAGDRRCSCWPPRAAT